MESIGTQLGQHLQETLDALLTVRFEKDSQDPDHDQTTSGSDVPAAKLVDEKEIGAQIDRSLNGFRFSLV